MDYETISVRYESRVAIVTMNRPEKLNPLGRKSVQEMLILCDEIQRRDRARAVVLTGAGRAFCVGLDIGDMYQEEDFTIAEHERLVGLYNMLVCKLKFLDLPTIAAINGHALGAGFALAMACDIRIASDQAKIGAIFVQRGASAADMGTSWILPRAIKAGQATELMLTGDYVEPGRGEIMGLYNRVLPPDKVFPAALELAEKIAAGPPLGLKFTKRALCHSLWRGLGDHLHFEAALQSQATISWDFQEAWKAFAEKRPPKFQGR
jgi:enoyl-CoA hydratase/carnithine racemase